MNKLLILPLLALLAGCAAPGRGQDVATEALDAQPRSQPADRQSVEIPAVQIVSHGLLADGLAIAAGGGANTQQLREELRRAKAAAAPGFLIVGSGGKLDSVIIRGALDAQDLSGMTIYYAGAASQVDAIAAEVDKAKADFQYIGAR